MACNESLDCSTATDLTSSIVVSKLSTLRLHFAHPRFGKPSSSFNVTSNRALILDGSLSWLAFFYQIMLLYGGYKPQRIHKGGKPISLGTFAINWVARRCLLLKILSEHTPLNSVNVINVNNAIFN